ncbi:hypothetical protein F441_22090 [Phytophthora nicotianae CJ01A1]|uniref:Uncharacterized protein n=1 Tax=Phytophthora nicotianae CJ01A1 TaxID=1317063 RepID=W2VQM5_PHYNI|nr:hypothetical protein F441_22090 [Phytophthora nicotianae CJ01A1]
MFTELWLWYNIPVLCAQLLVHLQNAQMTMLVVYQV